jgi:uncharacterized protein YajQ (UPF0234 family)
MVKRLTIDASTCIVARQLRRVPPAYLCSLPRFCYCRVASCGAAARNLVSSAAATAYWATLEDYPTTHARQRTTRLTIRDQHMPSFDVVSDFDAHEASNGVDQANREVTTRFDFKGTGSKFELDKEVITLTSQTEFQLQQMMEILRQKMGRRDIDIACFDEQTTELSGDTARKRVILKKGIDADLARKLVKMIKGSKLKVQAAIQGDQLRITGKKRDVLQAAISLLKDADVELPLQYENFRD